MNSQESGTRSIADLVREKYTLLRSGDYFALLGVPRDADQNAVRAAYFALAKLLHPDSVARQRLQGLEREALEVFKAITEAYSVLTDRKRRQEYEAQTQPGARPVTTTGEMRAARDKSQEARVFFHKGTLFLQRRAFKDAEASFKKACELDPSNGRYFSYLGYAIMLNEEYPKPTRLEEARKLFERGVELSTNDHETYYFMSLYYKSIGDVEKQRQFLQDALTINPRHVESRRELRLLAMRQQKARSSGIFGAFQSLFSRFKKR